MSVTQLPTAQPRGIIATMADEYQMDSRAFEATIRATCMPKGQREASKEEFAAFLLVAHQYQLNPLLKEIYAFPAKGGGIVPVVSVDGWINLVNNHPQADGMEFDVIEKNGDLHAITCRIFRKDRTKPISVTEYLSECARPTDPWRMKYRMLRHKALIQAARYAFGFSGIHDEDEARDIAQRVTPVEPPPPPPPPEIAPERSRVPEQGVHHTMAPTHEEMAISIPAEVDSPHVAASAATIEEADDFEVMGELESTAQDIEDAFAVATNEEEIQEIASHNAADIERMDTYLRLRLSKAMGEAQRRVAAKAAPPQPEPQKAAPEAPQAPTDPNDPRTPEDYDEWLKRLLARATAPQQINKAWMDTLDLRDRGLNPPPTQAQRNNWKRLKDGRCRELRGENGET